MGAFTSGVAFFDSGIGGLTVLAECVKTTNVPVFYYYGDNARAPYGNLSQDRIKAYVSEIFKELAKLRPVAAVVACNTVTALCVGGLRKKYPFPVLGIEPALLPAAKHGGEIFTLATRATCQSERFHALCQRAERLYPQATVRAFACEKLAGAIEREIFNPNFDCRAYLPKGNPTAVVLGCTHYPFVKEQISAYYRCPTYDGGVGVAKRLRVLVDNFSNPLHGLNCGEVWNTPKIPEFWDGRPLFENSPPNGAVFTDYQHVRIYFLGTSAVRNRSVFEQMFANAGSKRGSGVKKIKKT